MIITHGRFYAGAEPFVVLYACLIWNLGFLRSLSKQSTMHMQVFSAKRKIYGSPREKRLYDVVLTRTQLRECKRTRTLTVCTAVHVRAWS